MTYIINPIWFYLIGVASNVGITLMIISSILLVSAGILFVAALADSYGDLDDLADALKYCKFKTFIIVGAILLVLSLAIPDKETSYTMLAASAFTQENIEYAVDTGKDIVDYVLEITEESMNLTKEGEE